MIAHVKKFYLTLFLFLFVFDLSQSKKQVIFPDSLHIKSFELLKTKYDNFFQTNNKLAEVYANSFLSKAKSEKVNLKIAEGYLMLSHLKKDAAAIKYLDSMLVISNRLKNTKYISVGNMYKGNFYYLKGRYTKALSSYLIAKQYSEKNSITYNIINFNIGLLKLELGDYEEANNLFLGYKKYMEEVNQAKSLDYLSCIFAIAYTYTKLNQIDLSDSYIDNGLKINKLINDNQNYANFLLVSGLNSYKRKHYNEAINKLEKASDYYIKNPYNNQNLLLCKFYIGKIFYVNNNIRYLEKFKQIDSAILKEKNLNIELKEIYPILIDYYKAKNDKEKQLFYIEHLLVADSLLNENKYNLSIQINEKYDTPNLISEKEKLISDLDSQNSKLVWISLIIGIVTVILTLIHLKNRKKIKSYKEQAEKLTKNTDFVLNEKISSVSNVLSLNNKEDNKSKSTLPSEVLEYLKSKFEEFENNQGFLDSKITLDNLAKEFNTNRDYLSKGVNELKSKNFSQYINELRINHIVEELKINPSLQKYTIAGIAEEAGYNNSESFTTSFKKITGTLPSYFIKALKET